MVRGKVDPVKRYPGKMVFEKLSTGRVLELGEWYDGPDEGIHNGGIWRGGIWKGGMEYGNWNGGEWLE